MSKIPLSQTGMRAVPDPLVDIFQRAGAGAAAYARTGKQFISLAVGAPDPALLPVDMYRELVDEVLRTSGPGALNYGLPQGLPQLREAFTKVLQAQGVHCAADDVLITSGGMEAISLGAWMLIDPGDTVITEGPGYAGALGLFEMLGAKVVQLPCDGKGIRLDALESAIQDHRPKLLSLMPDYQNPSGAVMPVEHRRKIAALLVRHDMFALEDGAYAQLCFDGNVRPPLQAFAPDRVVYATSVSKILAPAMRVGALVAPRGVVARSGDAKSAFNMQASAINQAVTALFLNNHQGCFDTYLQQLRAAYRQRHDALLTALATYLPHGYRWTDPDGGMFLWLTGPEEIDFAATLGTAIAYGTAYVPGDKFYAAGGTAPRNTARLNFASTPAADIAEAIKRLAAALQA